MYRMYKRRGYSVRNRILDNVQFNIVARKYYEKYGFKLVR